ncbi:MAG: oligosaccharide flippase family protein, partial [Clostridia bacterium]|nr:oligosaccharide flippase family protein [Clostridia bacterium]
MKKINFKSSKGVLLKNTFMLYILQFSTYLIALLVAPYQTRVLGTEVFGGVLEASAAIIVYFQLIIDFGFLLSATEEVSRERQNKEKLSRIMTSVTWCKFLLAAVSFVVLFILCQTIPAWKQKEVYLYL